MKKRKRTPSKLAKRTIELARKAMDDVELAREFAKFIGPAQKVTGRMGKGTKP